MVVRNTLACKVRPSRVWGHAPQENFEYIYICTPYFEAILAL